METNIFYPDLPKEGEEDLVRHNPRPCRTEQQIRPQRNNMQLRRLQQNI